GARAPLTLASPHARSNRHRRREKYIRTQAIPTHTLRQSWNRAIASLTEGFSALLLVNWTPKKLSNWFSSTSGIVEMPPSTAMRKGPLFALLMKLERLSRFSFEDPGGLVRIATDAGRLDWKKKFEQYIASRRNPLPKRKGGSRTPLPSKEQEQLEDAHREVRARFIAVEEQFSKLWSRETVTKEDGLKLLRRGKKLTKEIECELEKGIEKLKTLTRDSDSLSSSGSSSSIELSTSPEASSSLTSRSRGERNRDVPLPKPRKPKPPPPYKQKYKAAVQEKTRHNSPMLKPSNKIDSLQAPDQPRMYLCTQSTFFRTPAK
ncbi:hypothetical protein GBAR_LOCUS15595, partial [Geodia barretti]